MLFDQHIIDEILAAVSIRQVMESFGVKFASESSSGENMAFCPAHDNKNTPALSVNEKKGVYHCFSCQIKGNALTFLTEIQKMNFRDAVKRLADMARIDVSAYDFPDGAKDEAEKLFRVREELYRLNSDALAYFQASLTPQSAGMSYFHERGLSDEAIGHFALGFCPGSTGLLDHLRSKGWSEDLILSSGLVIKTTEGRLYDFFYDRAVFPVMDRRGRISGFSGRLLSKSGKVKAKYLNVSENPVFQKRYINYNLLGALIEIRETGKVYVVEGYLDVIGLWQAGIPNAVAPMGTALTDFHLKDLVRAGAQEIVFVFDGDAAGQAAAERAARLAAKMGVDCSFVVLSDDRDPFDASKDPGFKDVIGNTVPAIDFQLSFHRKAIPPEKGIEKFIRKIFEYVSQVQSEIAKSQCLDRLCEFIERKVDRDTLGREFRRLYGGTDAAGSAQEQKEGEIAVEIPKTLGMDQYDGPYEFFNQDGSRILLTKDYRMFLKKKSREWSKTKHEFVWEDDLVPIQSSHALFPRYKIRGDEDFIIVFECKRPGVPSRYISIAGRKFGEVTKLQNEMVNNEIAINVGKMRAPLFSYALTYAREVKNVVVGVNYIYNENDDVTGSFLVGYNYIYKDGKSYRAKDNIVDMDGEICYIMGHELKKVNEAKKKFFKSEPQPAGNLKEFISKADKLFHSREKSRITASFLGVSMLRERLLENFRDVPLLNFYGKKPSTGKTTLLQALSLITNQEMHRSRITEYQLYSLQSERANGLILIDDLRPIEYYTGFLKDSSANSYRPRINMEGKRSNPQIRNSVFMTTNHPITMVGDNDVAAVESRVINVPFYPEDQIIDVDAYGDLMMFVDQYRYDIYIDAYLKVESIDMDKLVSRIRWIERVIQKEHAGDMKSARIAELWAILLAVGEAMGLGINFREYLQFIQNNEKQNLSKEDLMVATLVECVKKEEEKAKEPVTSSEYTDKERVRNIHTVRLKNGTSVEPLVIPKVYWLKLSDLSAFIKDSQMLKDYSQENIKNEFYGLPFVEHHRIKKVTRYRDGQPETRVGTYIRLDFGHEDFSRFFDVEGSYVFSKLDQDLVNEVKQVAEGESDEPRDPGF